MALPLYPCGQALHDKLLSIGENSPALHSWQVSDAMIVENVPAGQSLQDFMRSSG